MKKTPEEIKLYQQMYRQKLGEYIKEKRLQYHLSKHDLATLCKITETDVYRLERGELNITAKRLSHILYILNDPDPGAPVSKI